MQRLDLHAVTREDDTLTAPEDIRAAADTVASIIYTSGTTGTPKGVVLTHGNFTALLAALAPIFPLGEGDRVLSVLPLHHTFEFTCGMLLPLSRGASVVYLDELTGEKVVAALKSARVTAMVGVPALWQLLERRIWSRCAPAAAAPRPRLTWPSRSIAPSGESSAPTWAGCSLVRCTAASADDSSTSSRAARPCPATPPSSSRASGSRSPRATGSPRSGPGAHRSPRQHLGKAR